MTREKELQEVAAAYAIDEVGDTCNPTSKGWLLFAGFMDGALWADQHPQWISVEDELPPIGGIVLVALPLGGELRVLPLSIKNERDFEYLSGMTHWMPLPQAPKKGGAQ